MVRARGWRTYRGSLRIARDTATQEAVQCEPGGEAGMEGQQVQWSGSGLTWAAESPSQVAPELGDIRERRPHRMKREAGALDVELRELGIGAVAAQW